MLTAYRNQLLLLPLEAEGLIQVSSSTRTIRGQVTDSQIDGVPKDAIIHVSADQCIWLENLLVCPEGAILALER